MRLAWFSLHSQLGQLDDTCTVYMHVYMITKDYACTSPPGSWLLGFQQNTWLSLAAERRRSESWGHQAKERMPRL